MGAVCGHHRRCPWLHRALRLPDADSIIMVNAVHPLPLVAGGGVRTKAIQTDSASHASGLPLLPCGAFSCLLAGRDLDLV